LDNRHTKTFLVYITIITTLVPTFHTVAMEQSGAIQNKIAHPRLTQPVPSDEHYLSYQSSNSSPEQQRHIEKILEHENALVLHMGRCGSIVKGIIVLATSQSTITRKRRLITFSHLLRAVHYLCHFSIGITILHKLPSFYYQRHRELQQYKKEFLGLALYALYHVAEQRVYTAATRADEWLRDRDNGYNLLSRGTSLLQYMDQVDMSHEDRIKCMGKDTLVNYSPIDLLGTLWWQPTEAQSAGARRAYVHPRCI
jgi:hypothetical protein